MYFFVSLIFISSFLAANPLKVELSARAAILINADTGAILFEKFPDLLLYPASTTKVATALYVLEREKECLSRSTKVGADCLKRRPPGSSEGVSWWIDTDAPVIGLKQGEEFALNTLFQGMLIASGNDAANALAEGISGDIGTFIKNLNEYILSIGCENTHFCNPHGLHHEEHVSTASDLALITKRALQYPDFREVVAKKSWVRPATNKQPEQEFSQTNRLLRSGRFFYDKAVGGKTGYHAKARYNLVAAAEHEGRTLISVVLGCEKSDDRYHDTRRLFDAAFSEKKVHHILLTGQECYSCQIEGAKNALQAILASEAAVEYFPSEEPQLTAKIYWNSFSLPIAKGQRVGEIRIMDQKELLVQTAPLFAQKEVKGTFFFTLKEKFSRFLNL